MAELECRHFNGYKPCAKNDECSANCPSRSIAKERILIVHLEALGAVLRSTSLLSAIKRKYPRAHITWVTKAPAQALLQNLADCDRVLTLTQEDVLKLSGLEFDIAYVVDKSLVTAGILKLTSAREVFGFRADAVTGAILPANAEAHELWQIGLSDKKKFFENQKSEQRLVHESLALGFYLRDEYAVVLGAEERRVANERRALWSPAGAPVIGINTGCSPTLKHKKLSIEGHRRLIHKILHHPDLRELPIVLLGGPEDSERNALIGQDLPVLQSPTDGGLRDGLASVAALDLVFSGDSLGMHMAIGLKKWVVAWFGPSCAQEIDLYGRGRKIMTQAPCSPCWKRVCDKPVMCYDQVDFKQAAEALVEGRNWLTSFSKPHSPETSFSPIPLIRRIRDWDPQSEIVLACRPGLGEFFLKHGLVNEVIEIDKRSRAGRSLALAKIRGREWDVILVPHESVRTALWVFRLRARRAKIGFRKWWNWIFFNRRVKKPMEYPDALRQLSLLTPLDGRLAEDFAGPGVDALRSPVSQATLFDFSTPEIPEWASMTLVPRVKPVAPGAKEFNSSRLGRRVFLAPGSVWPTKRWKEKGYEALASLLLARGYSVELVGSGAEKPLCDEIASHVPGVINHAGSTSLSGLVDLFFAAGARAILVANDSGAMHAAAVAGLPTVAIFGPTVLAQGFRPWQNQAFVVQRPLPCRPCGKHGAKICPIGTHECMQAISPGEVLGAVERLAGFQEPTR